VRENEQKWWALCEQAAKEQNPDKFMALIKEIDRLLALKEQRLSKQTADPQAIQERARLTGLFSLASHPILIMSGSASIRVTIPASYL
jgi:hypothetical protein